MTKIFYINKCQVMKQLEGMSRDMFGGRIYKHRRPGSDSDKEWVAQYHEGNSEVSLSREFR